MQPTSPAILIRCIHPPRIQESCRVCGVTSPSRDQSTATTKTRCNPEFDSHIMSLLQEYGSALASIIGSRSEKLTEWERFKLSSESLPAQLHAMFWGKSMADEEQKWRDAQPPMTVEGTGLGNERQGGDDPWKWM